MKKTCSLCEEEKSIDDFHLRRGLKDGHYTRCKTCTTQNQKVYYRKNKKDVLERSKNRYANRTPEQKNSDRARAAEYARRDRAARPKKHLSARLSQTYTTSLEKYQKMLGSQGNKCVCGTPFDSKTIPCVDHDHACCPTKKSCGKCVRGLLCRACNRMVGMVEFLAKNPYIAEYLERWKSERQKSSRV